ncbi:uncharacterized protein LOC100900676 [Galendromus occidentalis]|uniref:Uncharacterized protein LOC100900676 n=1 Tax=Galendromus occidentalis TaxID=34638 RepID=A0AAJ6QQV6_9ACAR|nr:uncharacterized protein LOC100900676 [Galendromus occidentalis]
MTPPNEEKRPSRTGRSGLSLEILLWVSKKHRRAGWLSKQINVSLHSLPSPTFVVMPRRRYKHDEPLSALPVNTTPLKQELRMKFAALAVLALVGLSNALEREQDFGVESSPAEESTVRTPVTTVKPNVRDDDDDDDDADDEARPTECSNFLCSAMCRRSGCQDAICLSNNRCGCLCTRQISPREFFRSIFGNGYTPRFNQNVPSFPRLFDFPTMPRFEDRFRDISKLLETLGKNDGSSSKVYYTMQHTCEQAEDCSHVCSNCTTSTCEKNYCQCLSCSNRDAVEPRSLGRPQETCSVAHECDDMCKGCVKVGCRYGNCQCGQCEASKPTEASVATTTEAEAADDLGTTPSSDLEETSTVSVDVFRLRPRTNETRDDVTLNGKCVPKRCNHACWERQCTKWTCANNRCDCDGCPEDMAVVVRNSDGRSGKPEDTDKYEIIF